MANNNAFWRQNLDVMDLDLDPTNPRIRLRASADHRDCIDQLAEGGDHLVALSKDIASNGLGLDPVVVEPVGESWLVRDGNRRVACLHMLHNPQLAPERIRRRIQRAVEGASIPDVVECHVSDDKDAIREHMHRKHSGEGQGEGLRAWKTVEQARWEIDNGYPCDDEAAARITRYAEDEEVTVIPPDLPITTLTRFLNNERIQRIGFDDLSSWPPALNQPQATVVARVCKMIKDLDTKHINVSRNPAAGQLSMMDTAHQEAYLTELLAVGTTQGGAPSASGAGATAGEEADSGDALGDGDAGVAPAGGERSHGAAEGSGPGKGGARVQPPSWKRSHVAAPVGHNGVPRLPSQAKKAKAVHHELGRLNVVNFPNAAAVLVRMFLELSVDAYIKRKGMSCKKSEIAERIKAVADHMVNEGLIRDQREANGYKQHTSKETISTMTLHGFVHHQFIPDQQTVNTFWDNMLPFLRNCWHD